MPTISNSLRYHIISIILNSNLTKKKKRERKTITVRVSKASKSKLRQKTLQKISGTFQNKKFISNLIHFPQLRHYYHFQLSYQFKFGPQHKILSN